MNIEDVRNCCLALVLGNVVQLKWDPAEFDEAPIPDAMVVELIDRAYSYVRQRLPKKVKCQFCD